MDIIKQQEQEREVRAVKDIYPEVEEYNRIDPDAVKDFVSSHGKRIGNFKSSIGFYRGIYLKKCNFFKAKLSFIHVVGGPRKDGYIRYSTDFFLQHKDGHISFNSILRDRNHQQVTPTTLKDLNKMIELAHIHLNIS